MGITCYLRQLSVKLPYSEQVPFQREIDVARGSRDEGVRFLSVFLGWTWMSLLGVGSRCPACPWRHVHVTRATVQETDASVNTQQS